MSMPTLCAKAGPLPSRWRSFVNQDGDLQVGDAFGLEAQWVLSMIESSPHGSLGPQDYYPEMEWSRSQIEEDERGVGCVECGNAEADTVRGLCWHCR